MLTAYIIQTPEEKMRITIKRLDLDSPVLGKITRYRAKCGKVEVGGKTEKAAYFKLLKLLIKNQ
jgi:hypothetical protein